MRVVLLFALVFFVAQIADATGWRCHNVVDKMTNEVWAWQVSSYESIRRSSDGEVSHTITPPGAFATYRLLSEGAGDRLIIQVEDGEDGVLTGKRDAFWCRDNCRRTAPGRIRVAGRRLYKVKFSFDDTMTPSAFVLFSWHGTSGDVPADFVDDMKAGRELWIEATTAPAGKRIYKIPLSGFTAAWRDCQRSRSGAH